MTLQTSKARRIKALAFDMQGTIFNFYDPMMETLARVPAAAADLAQWSAFAGVWSAAAYIAFADIAAGRKAWMPAAAVYANELPRVLARFPGGASVSKADRALLLAVWGNVRPWDDVLPGLTALRESFVLATLTNASMRGTIDLVRRTGLPFDAILSAELAGALKPDPQVYRLGCKHLGCEPEEAMMVSAHKWDLRAAKQCGMQTALVLRPREYGPATTLDASPDDLIDVIAPDLPSLASLLAYS